MDADSRAIFKADQPQSISNEVWATKATTPRDPSTGTSVPVSSSREDDDNNKRKSILKVPSHGKARGVKKYYNRQNALIDAYLNSSEEEATEVEDTLQNGWKVKLAVNGSFSVNCFLFIIQIYAAVSTGSLSLFGTAADAFVSLPKYYPFIITCNG
jgi:hypothetical protein